MLELDPVYVDAWNHKIHILGTIGKHQEAMECCVELLKMNPNDSNVWYYKGRALEKLDKIQEALECYEKALELYPHCELAIKALKRLRLGHVKNL